MKYKWTTRRFWKKWFQYDIKRWYYSVFFGFKMGALNGTMLPSTGKGKFVSVYSKGSIIQIKHENGYEHLEFDEIRIIPYKENHGIMIERFKNGRMFDRRHMDLKQLNKSIIFASNIEQLTNKNNL